METTGKFKELIAIGASITANCQPCLQFHVDKAVELGATPGEVAIAIEVGKSVRKGAAAKMDLFPLGCIPSRHRQGRSRKKPAAAGVDSRIGRELRGGSGVGKPDSAAG